MIRQDLQIQLIFRQFGHAVGQRGSLGTNRVQSAFGFRDVFGDGAGQSLKRRGLKLNRTQRFMNIAGGFIKTDDHAGVHFFCRSHGFNDRTQFRKLFGNQFHLLDEDLTDERRRTG